MCDVVFIFGMEHMSLVSGTSWMVVDSPCPDVGAIHTAVGINVVWTLTKDNKVRKFCTEHYKRHKRRERNPETSAIYLLITVILIT